MILAQILAVIIFIIMFFLVITDKFERHYVTLGCGIATVVGVCGLAMHSKEAVLQTLNIGSIFHRDFWYAAAETASSSTGINWATILFILGMMVMVEGMAKAGFFRWLCLKLAKMVQYKPVPLFITFIDRKSVV